MFCPKCGKQIMDEAVVCPNCGCAVKGSAAPVADAPSPGYAVLGFFIPLVGLILYLMKKDTEPLRAKSAGKGALIGFIVSIVGMIAWGIVGGILASSMMYYY